MVPSDEPASQLFPRAPLRDRTTPPRRARDEPRRLSQLSPDSPRSTEETARDVSEGEVRRRVAVSIRRGLLRFVRLDRA
jgi:hypothetical protein